MGALELSQVLASLVAGVNPRDPATIGGVCIGVLAVALLASVMPAIRASKTDPLRALRYE